MKILWVSSRLIGPAASIIDSDYKGSSGSWIQTEYEEFNKESNKMYYLCGVKESKIKHRKNIFGEVYCVKLPKIQIKNFISRKLINQIQKILYTIEPDIIHIWGTETYLQYIVSLYKKDIPKVVYLQGILGIHSRYRDGYIGISDPDYYKQITTIKKALQIVKRAIFMQQVGFEKQILKNANNVILDNEFSKAYCEYISPNINVFRKQLNAGNAFFKNSWSYDKIEVNSIFTIYGPSPDKGLHQLLKAIKILKNTYPLINLYLPGPYKIDKNGELIITKTSSSYEKWIKKYININNLNSNIHFLGTLNSNSMAEQISKCNVFVNPSCMEVHALSLREAMAVGAPCISSICGSVIEYLKNNENGMLYRYEEFEILAYLIKKVLSSEKLATKLGKAAKETMIENKIINKDLTLESIYKQVLRK